MLSNKKSEESENGDGKSQKEDDLEQTDFSDEDDNEIASRIRSRKNCIFRGFYLMVTNPAYNFAVFVLILANTVVLATDDFP
jgi:hypothetical protein